MNETTYLDHNATTPVRPTAAAAVVAALDVTGNPSSVHGAGRAARRMVEDARDCIAGLFGAGAASIVFTSGGTEANTLALTGSRRRVLVSDVEHASVLGVRTDVQRIRVDSDGVVDVDALDALLAASDEPALVSVMLANNETGVIQPVAEVAEIAHRYGANVHCDAVQAAGKIAVDVAALGVDAVSLSAHKLGGPTGVGALIVADDSLIAPMLRGGGQERGRRAGTENLPGIAGFAVAAKEAVDELGPFAELAALRDDMEAALRQRVPETRFYGIETERLANTSCFASPSIGAETQVMALDLAGIAVSAGAACSSGKVAPSHVLRAMGADEDTANKAIRVSLGRSSSVSDVERFVATWSALHGEPVSETPAALVA